MGLFTVDDLDLVSALVLANWHGAVEEDWSVPAGTLEWSCLTTADHTIDCVFSYALFLGSRRLDEYPPFGELHALPEAGPSDMVDGLRAVTTMLSATIRVAPPETRAVLRPKPNARAGGPDDFAARGTHELILHAHDIAAGLQQPLDPPAEVCERLYLATDGWFGPATEPPAGDPWAALLARSGR
ncbi:MAG: hypothetical protein H0W25_21315 [Acidimicrobiia bacterium]|nr:hypothetical protein [Acidimicrobiia bacterium]